MREREERERDYWERKVGGVEGPFYSLASAVQSVR